MCGVFDWRGGNLGKKWVWNGMSFVLFCLEMVHGCEYLKMRMN